MASRQDRRRRQRELVDLGRKVLAEGLPNPVGQADMLGVGLILHRHLTDRTDPTRATCVAEICARLLSRTTRSMPAVAAAACRRGCAFCCHSTVSVTAPEAFRLARAVRQAGRSEPRLTLDQVLARCAERDGLGLEDIMARHRPCPLLLDDACAVHEARPNVCRQFFSPSAEACRDQFEGRRPDIPFIAGATNAGVLIKTVALGAMRAAGLSATAYELASALAAALRAPDAERRWLAGESVIAGAHPMPRPPAQDANMRQWEDLIRAAAA